MAAESLQLGHRRTVHTEPAATTPHLSLSSHQEISMSSVGYHEPIEALSEEVRDMHRAIVSLMEELEDVDW